MAVIKEDENNFEEVVLKNDKKVLVDFNATWCGPCRMMGPVVEELSEEMSDISFVSIDVDECEDLSKEYDVFTIPCLVVFEKGKEVSRSVGFIPKEDLMDILGGK